MVAQVQSCTASSLAHPAELLLPFQELLRRNRKEEMKHSLRLPNKTSLVLGGRWLPGNSARHFHRTTTIFCAPQAVRILTNSQSIFTHFRFSNKMFNRNHNRKVMYPMRFSVWTQLCDFSKLLNRNWGFNRWEIYYFANIKAYSYTARWLAHCEYEWSARDGFASPIGTKQSWARRTIASQIPNASIR